MTGSDDNTARVWDVPPFIRLDVPGQAAHACAWLKRFGLSEFTDAEYGGEPIMAGRGRDPCHRIGLLSPEWYRARLAWTGLF